MPCTPNMNLGPAGLYASNYNKDKLEEEGNCYRLAESHHHCEVAEQPATIVFVFSQDVTC